MLKDHPVPAGKRQRLLIFNIRTDADDHILGFTTQWINQLASYYQAVDVLTMHAGRLAVAANVRVFSVGRERGVRKWRRVLNFYSRLARLLTQHHYDACFAHMTPLFAAMAAPLLQLRGVRMTTWYTHRQLNRAVIWAERLSYRVVSAVPGSFPLASPKLRAIGHGIDTDWYRLESTPAAQQARVIHVARLTAIKNQHILLHAARNLDCEIVLVGDIPDGYDDRYKRRLLALVEALGMQEKVIFAGAQTPAQLREWYAQSSIAVNLSPPGLFDKAALEGMAAGLPVVVSNAAFLPLTDGDASLLHIPTPDDIEALQRQLQQLLSLSAVERRAIGSRLQMRVSQLHSLKRLIPHLINVMHSGEIRAPCA